MAELILGQIPEAVYFALFLIFAKGIKEKRFLFTLVMVLEYVALTRLIQYDVWLQISYTFMTYLTLRVIYKEKAQITDLVTFTISSIWLMITSAVCFFLFRWNTYVLMIINRSLIFISIYLVRDKIYLLNNVYRKIWNRHNDTKTIKSVTFRSLFVVTFNLMFYIINLVMLYILFLKK